MSKIISVKSYHRVSGYLAILIDSTGESHYVRRDPVEMPMAEWISRVTGSQGSIVVLDPDLNSNYGEFSWKFNRGEEE